MTEKTYDEVYRNEIQLEIHTTMKDKYMTNSEPHTINHDSISTIFRMSINENPLISIAYNPLFITDLLTDRISLNLLRLLQTQDS